VNSDRDSEVHLRLLTTMLRIRRCEEKVFELFLNNRIPGFSHVSIGQEAVAAGVCVALAPDDYITSTHRGHGHGVAKGLAFDRMFAELMGRRTGYCHGKGGSMHIADFQLGVLGANGIVGGGLPIATGAALSAQIQQNGRIVACFFGDGAVAEGAFHESLNMAALWKLPIIFVCENNQYGEWTHYRQQHPLADLSQHAHGYGIVGQHVDGMDVGAVYAAAAEAVERARRGDGPTLLECATYRYHGHSIGGPKIDRPQAEVDEARGRDPIKGLTEYMHRAGQLSGSQLENIESDLQAEILAAVAFAESSAYPQPEEALEDLFV
jgi:acetoin:2,6-dichlorophenolindophenol oxidoreductase subunit alpha